MGAAVEIGDIKIINQCLEVQGGVVACLFSVCYSLNVYLSHYFSLFSLSHTLSFVLSLEAVKGRSPKVSPVKVVLNAPTHESAPEGQPSTSHLAVKGKNIVYVFLRAV